MTGKARSAIRRATRDAVRAQYAVLGRQIVAALSNGPARLLRKIS